MKADKFSGHLDVLILAALKSGPAHGYLISERLRLLSDEYLNYPDGTMYPALHKLEERGMVESTWSSGGGRRRRVYKITRKGSGACVVQADDWRRYVRAVSAVIEGVT